MALTVAGEGAYAADLSNPDGVEAAILDAARSIVGRLDSLVKDQMRARAATETRWLEDLRNYHGRYDPTTEADLKNAGRSLAFVKLTRHKTNGWSARLSDLLFPTDDRNWGIQPTPLPKLASAAKEAQEAAASSVDDANLAAEAGEEAGAQLLAEQAGAFAQKAKQTDSEIAEAKKRSEAMQAAIEDQLVESNYGAHCRDVIEDGCRLGTGILKGPLTSNRLRAEWRNERGYWELAQVPDPQPEFVRVDPWHFFPDMSARTIQEAEFTFERSLPTKKDLRRYALKLGFNRNAVRRLLREGPGEIPGTDLTYLSNLQDITGEGEGIKGRFVLWEYHGPLECEDILTLLRAAGNDEAARAYDEAKDPLEENRVIIHFCNDEVLKIAPEYPLDSGESLYSVWNFEKGETSVFGIGIPAIMNDSQRAINGAWRMMMDNSALSVGPQIVVDKGAVVPQDGEFSLKALKVWLKTTTMIGNPNNPPFQVFNIPNNQAQLAGIIELARSFIDEETSSPTMDQGDAGPPTQTLGGMSMLMNSANVIKRRVVKSFDDDLTTPTIRRAYDWNMQFNPDDNVKGDMQVDARGTSVLLVREIQSMHMMNIAQNWTPHPVLGPYVKTREAMVKSLQTLMIPPADILRTQEEADKRQQEMAAAAAPAEEQAAPDNRLEIATIEAETRIKVAEMGRDQAMAELAVREKISIAEVQAKFGIKQQEIASKERSKAADIAIEERRGQAAAERGQPETEAVGVGVG